MPATRGHSELWGIDLQSEHERYLVEKHFKKPVILYDYPKDIKAFYMRQNELDDNGHETVRAMDILFPGIGEIVGAEQIRLGGSPQKQISLKIRPSTSLRAGYR